jgi:hypothetical protein
VRVVGHVRGGLRGGERRRDRNRRAREVRRRPFFLFFVFCNTTRKRDDKARD